MFGLHRGFVLFCGRLVWLAVSPWVPVQKVRYTPKGGLDHYAEGNIAGNVTSIDSQLTNGRNHMVVVPILVGTPSQSLTCLLDSGSSDIWLPSFQCPSCAASEDQLLSFFRANDSATFEPELVSTAFGKVPQVLGVVYGGGIVDGFVVHDRFALGSTVVLKQAFLLAEEENLEAHRRRSWDGVCGLGWRGFSQFGTPFYEGLKASGQQPIFALVPGPNASSPNWFGIGEVLDAALAPGSLSWGQALQPHSFWVVDGEVFARFTERDGRFRAKLLVDTGTTFLLAPSREYLPLIRTIFREQDFHRLCGIDRYSGNIVICSCEVLDLPLGTLVISLGGSEYKLEPDDLFEVVRDASSELCILQVQQRPASNAALAEALGAPAADSSTGGVPLEAPVDPFTLPPLGRPFGSPQGGGAVVAHPLGPGPVLGPLGMPGISGKPRVGVAGVALQQVILHTLADGTVCQVVILRGSDGSALNISAAAVDNGNGGVPVGRDDNCLRAAESQQRSLSPDRAGGVRRVAEADNVSTDDQDNIWVVGDVFLRRHVVVFDFANGRMGFARPRSGFDPRGLPDASTTVPAFHGASHHEPRNARGVRGSGPATSTTLVVELLAVIGLTMAVVIRHFCFKKGALGPTDAIVDTPRGKGLGPDRSAAMYGGNSPAGQREGSALLGGFEYNTPGGNDEESWPNRGLE